MSVCLDLPVMKPEVAPRMETVISTCQVVRSVIDGAVHEAAEPRAVFVDWEPRRGGNFPCQAFHCYC